MSMILLVARKETSKNDFYVIFNTVTGEVKSLDYRKCDSSTRLFLLEKVMYANKIMGDEAKYKHYKLLEKGKTLMYHMYNLIDRTTKSKVGYTLAFINKNGCVVRHFTLIEMYEFLKENRWNRDLHRKVINANVEKGVCPKTGLPLASLEPLRKTTELAWCWAN